MATAHLSTATHRAITIRSVVCTGTAWRAQTRVQGNWFCHAVNPTPRKRFPCQPAQCQDSSYFPDCQSQTLSDFRLQKTDYLGSIMTDALLKIHLLREKRDNFSPCSFSVHARPICHPLLGSSVSHLRTTPPKGLHVH